MLLRLSNILILTLFFTTVSAQTLSGSDWEKLTAHTDSISFVEPKTTWMFSGSKSNFVKYNPLSMVLGGAMYFYQRVISRQFSAECLYDVSCSRFSVQHIHRHGIVKGVFLSADRVTRCNRLAAKDIHGHMINPSTGRAIDPFIVYDEK